jgi:hypothetical protein
MMRGGFMNSLVSVAAVLGVTAATLTLAAEGAAIQQIYNAFHHGDCSKAIKAVNDLIHGQNAEVDFIAGRMADEGVCIDQDSDAATAYYKASLELGNRAAGLEYGAKVGMGEGTEQSYERAGELCRTAGLDAAGQLSAYSLGYVCTVRTVAGKMMRESFPKGAIVRGGGAALVSFTASSGALVIRSLPRVGTADAQVGSNIQQPMIAPREEIKKAWLKAMTTVPKPDMTRLDSKAVDLPIDLEMTIEMGRDSTAVPQGRLLGGDVVPINGTPR